MAITVYTYSIAADITAALYDQVSLDAEINADATPIPGLLCSTANGDTLYITCLNALSAPQIAALDAVILAHLGIATQTPISTTPQVIGKVRAVSVAAIAGAYTGPTNNVFTTTADGPVIVDGVTFAATEALLLTAQAMPKANVVWRCTTAGGVGVPAVFVRDDDDVYPAGKTVQVTEGTTYKGSNWSVNTAPATVGTNDVKWSCLPHAVDGGLSTRGGKLIGLATATGTEPTEAMNFVIVQTLLNGLEQGAATSYRFKFPNAPTHLDFFTHGADVFQFVDTGISNEVTNNAYCGVKIMAAHADTIQNLVDAMNGVGTGAADGVKEVGGVNPVQVEDGTENILASVASTNVICESADAPGGTVVALLSAIVLSENMTDAANKWDVGNINTNTLGGQTRPDGSGFPAYHGRSAITVTAPMITSGSIRQSFPFAPLDLRVQVFTSTGARRGEGADTFVLNGTGVDITLAGGVDPDIQAGDIIRLDAYDS